MKKRTPTLVSAKNKSISEWKDCRGEKQIGRQDQEHEQRNRTEAISNAAESIVDRSTVNQIEGIIYNLRAYETKKQQQNKTVN